MPHSDELTEEVRSLFCNNVLDDPYPLYRRVREQSAFFEIDDFIIVTRHPHVREVYSDSGRFQSNHWRPGTPEYESIRGYIEALDDDDRRRYDEISAFQRLLLTQSIDPEHRRKRDVFRRAFEPRALASLEDHVQDVVDRLVDDIAEDPDADLRSQFGFRVPLLTHMYMLGVPESDLGLLTNWSTRMTDFSQRTRVEVLLPLHEMIGELREYVRELVDTQRDSPGELTFLPTLIAALDAGEIDFEELLGMCANVLLTGSGTTMSLIATGIVTFMRNRDQWVRLCEQPELAAYAVEECLRFEPPLQGTGRNVMEDVELGGRAIPAGKRLLAIIAAANHDPAVFAEPDRFLIERKDGKHKLTFAPGEHGCLGAVLSRMEGRVVFSTLARRHPDMELADEPVEWLRNTMLRTPNVLHVSLGAARQYAAR
jgi:hypothetical protein